MQVYPTLAVALALCGGWWWPEQASVGVTVEKARAAPRLRWPRAPPPRGFHSSRFGMAARTDYRLTVENLSSRVSWQLENI
ncbi:hypothetical protein E2C01_021407 [Portunus trituberculatus]|uniref:Uncharacterized protein n=1 Tax=Portunus trituberculatus TaxID=210409 RepID=A0A5B7E2I7_PORTR|nr:hypothetical protein [Portunus trituberculatus]